MTRRNYTQPYVDPGWLTVHSGQGDFLVETEQGFVLDFALSREYDPEFPIDFQRIVRFDLREWRSYWRKDCIESHIDIPDLGFWYWGEAGALQYDNPIEDFREELRMRWASA